MGSVNSDDTDMEDLEKVEETPRIDKVTPEDNTNRNFSDIADEIHDNLINLEILRDEYLRAIPQLKKLKGKKLKTALHYLAVIQTNVALMTVGLEDDSEDMDEESDGDEEDSDNVISNEDMFTDEEHRDDDQSECEDDEIDTDESDTDESDKDSEGDESDTDESDKDAEGEESDDESNDEDDLKDTEEESREKSNEEYLDFFYEADNFITKMNKEFLKKKVKKMKTFYKGFYDKEDNEDPENLVEIVKDALVIKDKILL